MKTKILFVMFSILILFCGCAIIENELDIEIPFLQTDENDPEATEDYSFETEPASATEAITSPEENLEGNVRYYLEALASDIGSREPGSEGEHDAAQYIMSAFLEMGYQTRMQSFNVDDDEYFSSANVIAVKPGESDLVIVVGAHYDSAYEHGSLGADDNASGVAVMLEAARQIYEMETPYTIQFVAFGSEEYDLNGSSFFVGSLPDEDLESITGMVNLDSLIAGDKVYIYGNEGPGSMRDWLLDESKRQGYRVEGKTDEEMLDEEGYYCECSDNDAFEKAGIQYVYFEATNWDLSPDAMIQVDPRYGDDGEIRHTEYDQVDYIDQFFPGRIDEHLNLFSDLLIALLTEYPIQP